jgi:Zn-dependent peptidase ImmA (M78 family)
MGMHETHRDCGKISDMDINHKDIEIKALRVLDSYNISKPVVDVSAIAKGLGVEIKETELPQEYGNVAGFYDKNNKTIYVQKNDPPHRKLFSIAHELGHIVLGHEHATVQFRITNDKATPYSKEEKEANSFARHLLIPDFMLKNHMLKYSLNKSDYETLAKMFGVPFDAMLHTLERLR